MKSIRNSISNFGVRTLPRSSRNGRNTVCWHREEHHGLFPDEFMPMGNLDLMAFYVQRQMDSSKQAPEDILKLIEQLSNVEEKVKAMEEKLGGVRHKQFNILPVKENHNDRPSTDQRRKKMNRKRRKGARCLCFPWGCRPEVSETVEKKRPSKSDGNSHNGGEKETDALQNGTRNSRVSWDEDITVRYIGDELSADETERMPRKKKKRIQKHPSDDESPDEPPNEDVKDVVHVKIRIPKHKKDSASNVIEITGQNIERNYEPEDIDEDLKNAALLKVVKSERVHEDAAPEVNVIELDEGCLEVPIPSPASSKSTNTIGKSPKQRSKTLVKTNSVLEKPEKKDKHLIQAMDSLNNSSETKNTEERRGSPKPRRTSDISRKSEPKMNVECNVISDTNSASEDRINLDSRRTSRRRGASRTEETTGTKKTPGSRRSSITRKDESYVEDQNDFEHPEEYVKDDVTVDPITMIGRSDRISEHSVVGIPVKEPGRRTCGSQGCKCRGSTKNDSNLYELKKTHEFNESDSSLLERMVEKSVEPEEVNINTDFGTVNVVTHGPNCNCIVCQTFGSREETPRRNSIRSDTGAIVSKRVVRVRYNDDFRNVLTHTEECGCAICVGIDEQMYMNRFRRSTQISTRDSILLVQNKGVCGCTDCKTVTSFHKPSKDMEEFKNDIEVIKHDMETMVSKASYRTIDPCYYSDATIPSINSFPLEHFVAYENPGATCPSIDSLDSSEEGVILPKKGLNYREVIVRPKVKQVSVERTQHDTNNSLIIISAKPVKELGVSNDPFSNEWQRKPHKKCGHRSNKNRSGETALDDQSDEGMECESKNCNYKQETIKDPAKCPNTKNKRNKAREVKMYNKGREKPENMCELKKRHDDSRGRKSHKNSKRTDRSAEHSRKHRKGYRVVTDENHYERSDPQTTLEEIIKDLVSGQTDESGDKTYTVTLGKIHDKPFTKVKIIDCSKPQIESCSSTSSSSSQHSPEYSPSCNQDSSNSTVYFLKPVPSINVSPTCSSNFARSGETSVLNISHSIVMNNQCQDATPVRRSCSQSISPSPSLFIMPSIKDCELESQDDKPTDGENEILLAKNSGEHRAPPNRDTSPPKSRPRAKNSKFTIKLSGKVCSFFKRNSRKKAAPGVISDGNSIINK